MYNLPKKEEGAVLMRELLVDDRRETGEDGRECRYRYYILVGEMPLGGLSCESYGVKVVGEDGEEASVPDITVSAGRIDALLELLSRNSVSPAALRDVIDDWL